MQILFFMICVNIMPGIIGYSREKLLSLRNGNIFHGVIDIDCIQKQPINKQHQIPTVIGRRTFAPKHIHRITGVSRYNPNNLTVIKCKHNQQVATNKLPSVYGTNCRSLTIAKMGELQNIATSENIDIILLTETWLSEGKEKSFFLNGYKQYTSNRNNRPGGGVAVFVKSDLTTKVLVKYTSSKLSTLWMLFQQPNRSPIIYAVVYHPPGLTKTEQEGTIEHILSTVSKLALKHKSANYFMYGDFNHLDLTAVQETFKLKQIVNFPTRGTAWLDLILTDVTEYQNTPCNKGAPLTVTNDHCAIIVSSPAWKRQHYVTKTRRLVTTGSKVNISVALAKEDFQSVLSKEDVDDKVECFHNIIESIYKEHCPQQKIRVREKDPLLVTPLTIKLKRAKDRLYNKGNPAWKFFAHLLKNKIQAIRRNYCKNNVNALLGSGKAWWKNIKHLTQPSKTSEPDRIFLDNKWQTMADFVENQNNYYSSITENIKITIPQCPESTLTATPPPSVTIGEVKMQLRKLCTTKATHSADFPAWISKQNADDVAVPLADIINNIFASGKFPTKWKSAEIMPLNKITNPQTAKDFRPISLLWHCGKVAESFIVRALKSDVSSRLHANQYAYQNGKGTTEALVHTLTDWVMALDDKDTLAVNVAFVDFSKAFDMMRPDILILKLRDLCVNETIIYLAESFLTSRSACTVHRQSNSKSSPKTVHVGVPQGTLLGPILWNIFVNDLQPDSKTIKYADDTTVYTTIKKKDPTTINRTARDHCISLLDNSIQKAASGVLSWSNDNGMSLNVSKTKSMFVSLRDNVYSTDPIVLNGSDIENVTVFKLLGVNIDSHLKFDTHVDIITSKARSKSYALVTLKRYGLDQASLLRFYVANIRPALCYAAPAWYCFLGETLKDRLEKVQRYCFRIIYTDMSYSSAISLSGVLTIKDFMDQQCSNFVLKVAGNATSTLTPYLPKKTSRPIRQNKTVYHHKSYRTVLGSRNIFCSYMK